MEIQNLIKCKNNQFRMEIRKNQIEKLMDNNRKSALAMPQDHQVSKGFIKEFIN